MPGLRGLLSIFHTQPKDELPQPRHQALVRKVHLRLPTLIQGTAQERELPSFFQDEPTDFILRMP